MFKNSLKLLFLLILFVFLTTNICNAQILDNDIAPTVEEDVLGDIFGSDQNIIDNKKSSTPKVEEPEELITFSARNISVKDAFATLARISGKSISVGSDIRDDETISVIEIKEQPFEEAFYSLVDAARVNYTQSGETYTVIKGGTNRQVMIFGLGATAIDKSLSILERRADLSYDNQDLATLLKDLANKFGIDIVLTATPTERVSARVRDVNIEEALSLVLSGTSFDYTRVGEEGRDTYVIYNRLNKNFTAGHVTKLFTLMNLEAMDIQNLLPVQVRANVRISNDQNAIIADGSLNDLQRIEEFLKEVDKPLPQVELEVKLIEISRTVSVDWMILQSSPSIVNAFQKVNPYAFVTDTGFQGVNLLNPDMATGFLEVFMIFTTPGSGPINMLNLGIIKTAPQLVTNGGLSTFKLNSDNIILFNDTISYLENRNLAEIRACPKLVSLSGRTAMINIDVDTNLVLGAASTQGVGVVSTQQLQRITAGTALSITPVVGSGGLISAMVQIEVSDNSGFVEQAGLNIPQNTTRRRINNEIQLRDGETVAIGGLIVDNSSNGNQGLPWLTRLPVFKDFFSNTKKNTTKSELIVLITPRIRNIVSEEVAVKNFDDTIQTDVEE